MNLKIHPDALVLNQASRAGKTPEECRILKAKDYKLPLLTRYCEGTWKEVFYFVQVVGPQFGRSAYPEESVEAEEELMEKLTTTLNKMKPKPRFVAICGNFTRAGPSDKDHFPQVEAFKSSLEKLDSAIPVICVCGSNDIGEKPCTESVETYRRNFGEESFSFWVEGVQFLVLNSVFYRDLSDEESLRKEQQDWLESNLLEAQVKPPQQIVVLQSIPWFCKSINETDSTDNIDFETRHEIISKLKEAGVKAVFSGNKNSYSTEGNLEVILTSSLGESEGDEKPGVRIVKVLREKICHGFFTLDDCPEDLNSTF